jgi:hypothetical protein
MPVLVRPHPQRLDEWQADERTALSRGGDAVLWGSNPIDPDSRADYFDSMYHAAAVVGLNTSALVEAAIVDRPVLTILLPEFRDSQEGTFHFHHLLQVGGGFLTAARSLEEHVAQLNRCLHADTPSKNRAFVEQFIRPRGVRVAATPVFADAVEELASTSTTPHAAPAWIWLLRPVVYALVLAGRVPWLERMYWNPVKRREWANNVRAMGDKDVQRRAKRRDKIGAIARKVPQRTLVWLKTTAKQALGAVGLTRQS